MKLQLTMTAAVLALVMLGGCVTTSVGPGSKQSDTPPQIVTDKQQKNVWDHPDAFGPVPEELKAKGLATCVAAGFKEALGYHTHAKDINGKEFADGAYLCAGDKDKK